MSRGVDGRSDKQYLSFFSPYLLPAISMTLHTYLRTYYFELFFFLLPSFQIDYCSD